jgi:hypothetical protein
MPEKMVDVLSPPLVSVELLASTMLPAPAIEPTVSLASTAYVPVSATLTAVLSAKLTVTDKVPALMVVAPV